MLNNPKKKKGYIITDMEIGDNPDNIILMYEEPILQFNNEDKNENEEKDLQS